MTVEKTLYRPTKGADEQPLKVRKPQGGYLAFEGEALVLDTYWLRRLQDKDIEPAPASEPNDTPALARTAPKATKA